MAVAELQATLKGRLSADRDLSRMLPLLARHKFLLREDGDGHVCLVTPSRPPEAARSRDSLHLAFREGHLTVREYVTLLARETPRLADIERSLREWYVVPRCMAHFGTSRQRDRYTVVPYDDNGRLRSDLLEHETALFEGRDPDPANNGRNSDDLPLHQS